MSSTEKAWKLVHGTTWCASSASAGGVAHAFADISGLAAQAGRVHQTVNTMNDPKWAISRVIGNLKFHMMDGYGVNQALSPTNWPFGTAQLIFANEGQP